MSHQDPRDPSLSRSAPAETRTGPQASVAAEPPHGLEPPAAPGAPHELAARVSALAERFSCDATMVERADTLPAAHLDGLERAGLYGALAPTDRGGLGLGYLEYCAVIEELAAGCLASTFVWIQHFGLLRALLEPSCPEHLGALLPRVTSGEIKGGIALAGLLPGPPRLRAEPTSGGWLLDGEAPWMSGWGLVDTLLVAARGPRESIVTLLVEAREQPGLSASRMPLSALNASSTVRLGFDRLLVGDDRFLAERPFDPARQAREGLRANGSLALGVVRRCCTLLGPSRLDDELRRCREELDAAEGDAVATARASASELAVRAASALAVTRGSSSALVDNIAERSCREAVFLLVFGSRPAIKQELLARFGAASGKDPSGAPQG